ncbi:DcaP family trimeric outer membrane transporter [Pseudohongiella spirulinae]|uniref:DcaP family trimeric outer membrane transporter n=1 Tax=Pseudohongiella spirulinae TaxID=1249552 RepID=UPI0007176481|nr:DcaP family trimeric outer membrane transporter [Pseudohongiella spirulinae]
MRWAGLFALLLVPSVAAGDIELGGYLKLNAILSDRAQPGTSLSDQTFSVSGIPLRDGKAYDVKDTQFHAKESRFWMRGSGSVLGRNAGLLIEYDLLKDSAAYQPRRRHLYATVGSPQSGQLLVGQTYSTFANSAALADTDAGVSVGNIVTRQPMLRWMRESPSRQQQWVVSFEEPLSRIARQEAAALIVNDDIKVPDVILKWQTWQDWGSLSVAGMIRQLHAGQQSSVSSREGGAISIAAIINLGMLHNTRIIASAGNALGRYAGSHVPDAFINAAGEMQLRRAGSLTVAYQHFWTQSLRSTLSYGLSRADLPGYSPATLVRDARSLQVNLLWTPVPGLTLGAEYVYGHRAVRVGTQGELNRLQMSLRWNL